MIRKQSLLVIAAVTMGITLPAFPQDEPTGRNDVTVQAFGSFVKSTTSNGVEQDATNSGGVLASYRFLFSSHNGVEVNYGYSLNTQNTGLAAGSIGVPAYSHEVSAAYVFRFERRRWSPFLLAGAAGLIFDPKDGPGINSQARAAFIYGGGADVKLTHHVFLRAEYRGFVYNSPSFNIPALQGTDRITHRAEPSIGFGYRF